MNLEYKMKNKVIPFPNIKRKWEMRIYEAFSSEGDVITLRYIEQFHQLYAQKITFQLLASLCHYHLGEEDEGIEILEKVMESQATASKEELYAFYVLISEDGDFWAWREWIVSYYRKLNKHLWLKEWLEGFQPPSYMLLRNVVDHQQVKLTPFLQRFVYTFHNNYDFEMQLLWLQSQEKWEKTDAFFDACQVFLSNEQAHPFIQTLLLQQLKFEGVCETFYVCKNGHAEDINLSKVDYPLFSLNERKMIHEIQAYEVNNVSYADQMLRIYQQYVMVYYPFVTEYSSVFFPVLVQYTDHIFGKFIDLNLLTEEEHTIFSDIHQANQSMLSL